MPIIHRENDSRVCGANTVSVGQGTFFVGGELVAVDNDTNSHGAGGLNPLESVSFFINGLRVARNGDPADADSSCVPLGGTHCAPSASSGFSTFIVGDT